MDLAWWIWAIVILALVAGLVANRWVRPFAKTEVQGIKLETMIGPVVTITVLLLAFSLVTVFASFQRAQVSASDEARKVDYLFELGQYLKGAERITIESATVCYALAVTNHEWETMAEGRTAPQVSPWTRQMRAGYASLIDADQTPSPVLSAILTADRDRGEARSRRLTEARPTIPAAVKFLFVLSASLAIFALGTFTLPYVRRRVQIGILVILSFLFVAFMSTIAELDEPYQGVIAVPAEDMARVAGDLSEDYAEENPDRPLPCDETGASAAPES